MRIGPHPWTGLALLAVLSHTVERGTIVSAFVNHHLSSSHQQQHAFALNRPSIDGNRRVILSANIKSKADDSSSVPPQEDSSTHKDDDDTTIDALKEVLETTSKEDISPTESKPTVADVKIAAEKSMKEAEKALQKAQSLKEQSSIPSSSSKITKISSSSKDDAEPSKVPLDANDIEDAADATKEIFTVVLDAATVISTELFSALRWGAANALTSSLPQDERNKLLERLQPRLPPVSSSSSSTGEENKKKNEVVVVVERGSIGEEIAATNIKESQSNELKWKKEREELAKKMEEAATERVKSELLIQKERLEKEQLQVVQKISEEKEELIAEKANLEELVGSGKEVEELKVKLAQEKKELEEQKAKLNELESIKKNVEELKSKLDEEQKLLDVQKEKLGEMEDVDKEMEELKAKLEKRKGEKLRLDKVEDDLREKINEIQLEKKRLGQLQEDVALAKKSAELPHYSPQEYRAMSEEEKIKLREKREAVRGAMTDGNDHPVLGPIISDLGYKRIHILSSGKLGTIPIWNKNRVYRHNRAKAMATEKSKSGLHLGFPGIICLHEDLDGKLSIVDGQHRVGMMAAMREKRKNDDASSKDDDFMFESVLVEVYPQRPESTSTDEHAQEIFLEINKAEPVQLIDMPGVASATDAKIINKAVERLKGLYPLMFSPSHRCRVPNVNEDNLRNSIFGARILKKQGLKKSKQLEDWLLIQNAKLGEMYAQDDELRESISPKAWKKASTNNFYLGLESSWLYK